MVAAVEGCIYHTAEGRVAIVTSTDGVKSQGYVKKAGKKTATEWFTTTGKCIDSAGDDLVSEVNFYPTD